MFFNQYLLLLTIAPFLLVPIEIVFPYPFLIETLVKLIAVLGLLKSKDKKISLPILGGFLFASTETVLYTNNIIAVGKPYVFIQRLFLTGGMHILTIMLIYLGFKKNKIWGILGLILAIGIHYFYNKFV